MTIIVQEPRKNPDADSWLRCPVCRGVQVSIKLDPPAERDPANRPWLDQLDACCDACHAKWRVLGSQSQTCTDCESKPSWFAREGVHDYLCPDHRANMDAL